MEPIRVLLVDDDDDLRALVRASLQAHGGFRVVAEACDGHEAIARVDDHQPDLVVLDLGLPDLAGLDVLTRIRALVPMLQIVVFTGAERAELKAQALAGGATEYLLKGDIDYLVQLLETVASGQVSAASLHLPANPGSARTARGFLEEHCDAWSCRQALDEGLVVVSELVTNALLHAATACELRIRMSRNVLRIEVADEAASSPDPQLADDDAEHGRGLFLVSALSRAWGVQPQATGKVVWAELAVTAD